MKKHPEHKIDELLHRSLHNLHGETSVQDWAEIQRRLQKEGKDKPWFWFIGSRKGLSVLMLLLLSFAGIGYYSLNKSTQKTAQTAFAENNNAARLKAENQRNVSDKNIDIITDTAKNKINNKEEVNHNIIKDKDSDKGSVNISNYSKAFKPPGNRKKLASHNSSKKNYELNKYDESEQSIAEKLKHNPQ